MPRLPVVKPTITFRPVITTAASTEFPAAARLSARIASGEKVARAPCMQSDYRRCEQKATRKSLFYDGHRLDFYQELWPEQPGHLNRCTGRWILNIDVLVAHFSEILQMREIHDVRVQFNYVAEVPARGFNSSL